MNRNNAQVMLPRGRLARWLVQTGCEVSVSVRREAISTLFKRSAAFVGGEINTPLVAWVIALRMQTWPFLLWAGVQTLLAILRLTVQIGGARRLAGGGSVYPDLYVFVALLWAATIGYGGFVSIASGDWMAATLACASAAAMAGAICFRSFAVPRLVVAMILLVLGPCALAALLSGEAIMLVAGVQLPLYLFSMAVSAFALNRMLLRTMDDERRHAHHARHDPLTGLLNRSGYAHWAGRLLARQAQAGKLAIFYLDLDGFKEVNDRLGHASGDALLEAVGERLRTIVRPGDVVARLGGDEFVIVAADADEPAARQLGARIVAAIAADPFLLDDVAAEIGVSVGAALFPGHGRDLDTLLRVADRALYTAKAAPEPGCVIAALPARAEGTQGWAQRSAA